MQHAPRLPLGMLRLLALAAIGLAAASPGRADVLDQSYLGPDEGIVNVSTTFSRAQTFQVGVGGVLTRLGLVIVSNNVIEGDELTIDVRPTDESGAPLLDDGSALGSVVVPATLLPTQLVGVERYEIDFSSLAIGMVAGERLAIVARSNLSQESSRQVMWVAHLSDDGGYDAGDAWLRGGGGWLLQDGGGTDLLFETFVEVPEPAGCTAVALGALLALHRRRRG